jgi:hypothetical protein
MLMRPKIRVLRYIKRVLIATSILVNVVLGGHSNQTFSARNHDRKKNNKYNLVWLIDFLIFWDADHCMMSWLYWKTRKDIRKGGARYLQNKANVIK